MVFTSINAKAAPLTVIATCAGTAALVTFLLVLSQQQRKKKGHKRLPEWSDYYTGGCIDFFRLINAEGLSAFLKDRRHELGSDAFFIQLPFILKKTAVICHPDDAAAVIAKEHSLKLRISMPPSYQGLHGEDLQIMSPEKHKTWRKILSAAFSPRALDSYAPLLLAEFSSMWDQLRDQEDIIVLRDEIRRAQLRVMSKLLFGFDFGDQKEQNHFEQLDTDFETESAALFSLPIDVPGMAYHDALKASTRIRAMLMNRFEEARRTRKAMQTTGPDTKSSQTTTTTELGYRSAMDAIIDAVDMQRVSDDANNSGELIELTTEQRTDISNNLLLLLEAAHGTTMFATTALFGELHSPRNTEILRRVQEEAIALDQSNIPWSPSVAKAHLPYLDACIQEVLRLYPFAGAVPVILPEGKEVCLPHADVMLRGPCDAFLSFGQHFIDEKVFPDPLRFLPERWYTDCRTKKDKAANNTTGVAYADADADGTAAGILASDYAKRVFTPFGMGAHLCLGQKLAFLTMKSAAFAYAKRTDVAIQLQAADIERVHDILPGYIVKCGVRSKVLKVIEQS